MDIFDLLPLTLSAILFFWVIILTVLYVKSVRHYKKLVKSAEGQNLVQILEEHFSEIRNLKDTVAAVQNDLKNITKADRAHLQRVGLVRFNPYGDTGGNQSFVLSLLDDQGNGVVVSALHSRDSTRVYCKPVRGWGESVFEFSDEEKQAVEKAKNNADY